MSENSSTGQTQKRRSSNSRRRKSNAGAKPNPAPAAQAAAGAAGSTESRRSAPRRRSAARPAAKQPAEGRQPQASPAAAVVQEGKPAAKRRRRRSPARPGTTSTETRLRIIPLGGMREIGKNLTVYEYDQDMIIVDCGITFPDEDMPGIDIVVPDFAYVLQNKKKLRGIFLTHGHEDHIGALPWLLRDIKVPVYGSRMTLELVRRKLEDRGTGVKEPSSMLSVTALSSTPAALMSNSSMLITASRMPTAWPSGHRPESSSIPATSKLTIRQSMAVQWISAGSPRSVRKAFS